MKIKITIHHVFNFVVSTFFLLCLTSCSQKQDASQFVTKESFDKANKECKDSTDKRCVLKKFEPKVEKYCSENKLPSSECDQIKIEVIQTITKYNDKEVEELKKVSDEINKMNDRMRSSIH